MVDKKKEKKDEKKPFPFKKEKKDEKKDKKGKDCK